MKIKRIIFSILAICMVLSTMGTIAFAESSNIATVNGVEYSSFTEVLSAVKASTDNNIVLLTNASVSGQNALDALTGDTLDLNGYTLTVNGNSYLSDGTTTIKNGNVVVTGYASDSYFCGYTENAVIVFDNVAITGNDYKTGCALFNANKGKIEVKNSEITISGDTTGGVIYGGAVTIEETTINATNVCRGITNSVAEIKNSSAFTFDGGETGFNNSTVTVDNSEITIKNATKRAVRLDNNTLALQNGATLTTSNCAADIVAYDEESEATVSVDNTSTLNAVNNIAPSAVAVATVNGVEYTDIQEAIKAAAPNGTVEIINDVVVDEWKMFWQGDKAFTDIIYINMNGLTINGNGHTLTINSIVSSSNGNQLFKEAAELNINDLTIKVVNGTGGIGLESGSIKNVTFIGGTYGVYPGADEILIEGCNFATNGTAIYFETARDSLVVTNNTFNLTSGDSYAIILRGNADFTNNNVISGKVNLAKDASGTISGNNFNDVRFKVYNEATANIENNKINVLVFNDDSEVKSTFGENTLSDDATQKLKDVGVLPNVIEIYDWEDLKELDAIVEGGNMLEGATVKLMADIDLYEMGSNGEPVTFNPIGANKAYFKGTFDGQGHTIKNMYQSGWALGYDWDNYGTIGLFAYLWNATVKDLTIENAECFIEGGNVASIAGCAWGDCTFENITVKNSVLATYNNRAAGIVGYTGGEGSMTFKNIMVDEDTVIAGLWGSFDSSLGGMIGSTQDPTKIVIENSTVKCRLDAYNDCTAANKYYAYRMCGMLIGKMPVDSNNQSILDNVTIANTDAEFGDWAHYTYVRNGTDNQGWTRVEAGYAYGGADPSTYTNPSLNSIPFRSLFGGQQYGSYGLAEHENVDVTFYPAAKIGTTDYWTLTEAVSEANQGDTVTLMLDVAEDGITLNQGAEITIDLNGKTLNGSILAPNAKLTVRNGSIINTNAGVSAIEINSGELTLTDVNIDSARHAVRIDGDVTAVIDGGIYRSAIGTGKGTYHALNISGNADVTIKSGTFTGPKGTSADSGASVNVQTGSTVTINNGTFTGGKNNTLAADGTLTVSGGTFDQNPEAYIADNLNVIYDSFKNLYTVTSEWTLSVTADDSEVYAGDKVQITVKASGESFTAADWKLSYDAQKFEFSKIITDIDDEDIHKESEAYISGIVMNPDSDNAYNNDTILAIYEFTAKAQTEIVTGAFTLTDASVGTVAMSNSTYPEAKVENDEVKILLKDFTVTVKHENTNEVITGDSVQIDYDGNAHKITVTTDPVCDIYYSTDNGNTWTTDAPEFTKYGIYTITYKADVPNGYDQSAKTPVTITVEIGEPEKVVEVADYVSGYKLILVYTDADGAYFTYADRTTLMLDVTSAGYKYIDEQGNVSSHDYRHVYGYVVAAEMKDADTYQSADFYKSNVKFAANTTSTPEVITSYDYDVNCSEKQAPFTANLSDVVFTTSVYNSNIEEAYMKAILKADTNREGDNAKIVDGSDIADVKTDYTNNR